MNDRLITIATYSTAVEANLARVYLEKHEIKVSLSDENFVTTMWQLGNAVNGVKLVVLERDAERALELMNDYHKMSADETTDPADSEQEYDDPADDEEPEEPVTPRHQPAEEQSPTPHDELASRAVRCAMFGLFVCPLQYAAAYFLLKLAFTDGEFTARGRLHRTVAIWICVLSLLLHAMYFKYYYFGGRFPLAELFMMD